MSEDKTTEDLLLLLKKAMLISNVKSKAIEIPDVLSTNREQRAYRCGHLQAGIDIWRCIAELLEFESVEKDGGS